MTEFVNGELSDPNFKSDESLAAVESDQQKAVKKCLYDACSETYRYVMTGEAEGLMQQQNPPENSGWGKYLGYSGGIEFDVDGIDWKGPSLQRLLSQYYLLFEVASAEECLNTSIKILECLEKFNYLEQVRPDDQEDFLSCQCLKVIDAVAKRFRLAIQKASLISPHQQPPQAQHHS